MGYSYLVSINTANSRPPHPYLFRTTNQHEYTRIDTNQDSCLPSCAFVVLVANKEERVHGKHGRHGKEQDFPFRVFPCFPWTKDSWTRDRCWARCVPAPLPNLHVTRGPHGPARGVILGVGCVSRAGKRLGWHGIERGVTQHEGASSIPGREGGGAGSSRQSEAVWGGLPLGPRASRPHRVCRGFRSSPCLFDPPWPASSRQDAGAPSVPGSRHTAFPVAKSGDWLGRST